MKPGLSTGSQADAIRKGCDGCSDCYLLMRAEGVLIRGVGEAVCQGEGKPPAAPTGVPAVKLSERGLLLGLSLLLMLLLHMKKCKS